MKKNILIIDNSTGWTGAFKSIATVTKQLSGSYQFHFCIPANSTNDKFLQEKNIPVIKLNFIEISKRLKILLYLPQLLLNAVRINRYCRNNRIAVVHVNDIYNLTGVVVKMLNPGIKLIYHIRLLKSSYAKSLYKYWIRIISKRTDYLVAVSQAAKTDAEQYTKKSVSIIYDCIDQVPQRQTKPESKNVAFLYLANYIPGKGHDVALKSFTLAFKQDSSIRLIMAGGDLGIEANQHFKRSLFDFIETEKLSEAVELRGFEPDVQKMMQACDVFLNFSASESFSMTCLEAITNGKPVIATNSGGPAEIVTHDYCGIIIPVGDVKAGAEAMLLLAKDTYKRDYFGRNALQQAADRFTLGREAAKLSGLYDA